MLATATSNCAVTNVTCNGNKYYFVTWTVYLESSMYLRRPQRLCHQIVAMCHIACWFRSSAVLKFDQLCDTNFETSPSLDLFLRKCTYAKVIDLRNMVLWSIGFIANRFRIPSHQISLCPLLLPCCAFIIKNRICSQSILLRNRFRMKKAFSILCIASKSLHVKVETL